MVYYRIGKKMSTTFFKNFHHKIFTTNIKYINKKMRWNYECKNKDCGNQTKGHFILRYCRNSLCDCPLNAIYSLSTKGCHNQFHHRSEKSPIIRNRNSYVRAAVALKMKKESSTRSDSF